MISDKELLSAYIIRPACQSQNPIIAYAFPLCNNLLRIVNLSGKELRIMAISELYEWAIASNVIVESPVTSKQCPYTDDDEEAYNALEALKERDRREEIEACMKRLRKLILG